VSAGRVPRHDRRSWALNTLARIADTPDVSVTTRNGARAAIDVLVD
jgi:hypothetical protein